MPTRPRSHLAFAFALALAAPTAARGDWVFNVTVFDPYDLEVDRHDIFVSNLRAAGAEWARHFGGNASLEVFLMIDPYNVPRAGGASAINSYVYTDPNTGRDVYEPGAVAEIRTGIDPTGDDTDIDILLNPDYIQSRLWFDPDPYARTAPVPSDRIDGVSLFVHELGHALGFDSYRDATTGEYVYDDFHLTWDDHTEWDGEYLYFNGPNAVAAYGRPVPIFKANRSGRGHIGNRPPGPGADLNSDVMNWVSLDGGRRYTVSPVDVGILLDLGLPAAAAVPEPGSAVLAGVAAAGLVGRRLRRRAG